MKNNFFSVGLEEEYLVVNKYNGELIVDPPRNLMRDCKKKLKDQVKPEFKNKWFVSVEAFEIADYLKTDKSGFRGGWWKYGLAVEREIFKELQKLGLISTQTKKTAAPQYFL